MKRLIKFTLLGIIALILFSCKSITPDNNDNTIDKTTDVDSCKLNFNYTHQKGCDGKEYPNPLTSSLAQDTPPSLIIQVKPAVPESNERM